LLVFKGLQKTTLVDFPGKVASTLFLPKCNFKCPFCYNKQLVFDKDTGFELSEEDAFKFFEERKGFIDGICLTGGEPLLHPGVVSFCKKVKETGLLVKLDTNGSNPKLLKELLEKNLLDYVAMDIKGALYNYEVAIGTSIDLSLIEESVDLLKNGKIDYEFRMTVVPGIHSEQDFISIGEWLKGSKSFFLQQFNSDVPLLDQGLEGTKPFAAEKLRNFAKILQPFFEEVAVRGL